MRITEAVQVVTHEGEVTAAEMSGRELLHTWVSSSRGSILRVGNRQPHTRGDSVFALRR